MPRFSREMPNSGRTILRAIVRASVGIAVAVLFVFAVWAIRVEITYRNNIAINSRKKSGSTHKMVPHYDDEPCKMGQQCKGTRDALSSTAKADTILDVH